VAANYAQQLVLTVKGETFLKNTTLHQEVFGPYALVVECSSREELETVILQLEGQLTGTVIGDPGELPAYKEVINALQGRVGRLIFNGVPTPLPPTADLLRWG